jgi:hypothetical protein
MTTKAETKANRSIALETDARGAGGRAGDEALEMC